MLDNAIYAALTAFIVTAVLCYVLIPHLARLKFGQNIRQDGPEGHLKKAGTPTMGGIAIIIGFVVSSVFFSDDLRYALMIILPTVGFGAIGFLDDYIKTVKKRSLGLTVRQKIMGQVIVTACFTVYVAVNNTDTRVLIPFYRRGFDLDFLYLPLIIFVMIGGVNAVNLTDGLDGLCSGVTAIVSVFFIYAAWLMKVPVAPLPGAMLGSLLAFLLFNSHKASIFMGDTGSLALGGFVTSLSIGLGLPVFLGLVGIIYVAEVLSDIIQISYYKMTGGKRVFKMAPIHHHFEGLGYTETKITSAFCIITAIMVLIGILGFNAAYQPK